MILIAIAMALALAIIWWGARQRRRRAKVEARHDVAVETHVSAAPVEAVLAEPAEAMPLMPPLVVPAPPPPAPSPPPPADVAPVVAPTPLSVARPVEVAQRDELGRMKGVGPKLAARLAELGYTRFEQIAALTPAEADALDAQLGSFRGRLTRDRWVEQATYLANDDRAGFEAAFGRL
jgi:predicted flap endonuclease-1-like 5' DNA nuclease